MYIADISQKIIKGESVNDILDSAVKYNIGSVNWKEEYPYAPKVSFSLAHDREALYIKYYVDEECTLARVLNDGGEVWTDSCVEFFICFDNTGYYNFEFNCIGTALLSFRKEKPSPTDASKQILDGIERFSSIPKKTFEENDAPVNKWELMVKIPKESFFKHNIKSLNGIKAKANFYKCGDNLSKVHFLSWNPIDMPTPNFHVPQFFAEIDFE